MLLKQAESGGGCCLRLYSWATPTLSLGYFQRLEDRLRHAPSIGCPVVRRISGGGAIVHDREVTYSLSVPADHRLATKRRMTYKSIHQTLVELLKKFGVESSIYGAKEHTESAVLKPFLCFQRRSPGDIVVGRVKVVGSAQRRTKGAILQHGSVLVGCSVAAPELLALNSIGAKTVETNELVGAWLEKLSTRLDLSWKTEPLSKDEKSRAKWLSDHKYGSDEWTRHRCQ